MNHISKVQFICHGYKLKHKTVNINTQSCNNKSHAFLDCKLIIKAANDA